ncbi:DUF1272 domain-containing protein [Lentibacter algarum]|uniref:DUF1272 domain-containing protein n=1 Tax=Lentibacter algarum TaxID=576131 RepID=UPI001C076FCC|nr:DUF1272 domain-containing protein [Lentibacter algarum]MBU2981699.1 DUF1272 domain-containing protein [Lentibacter algarum]
MLELRPNCELCDRDLPHYSPDARICTYECTYCVACVENVLHNVCPTCGGNFVPRPIRPHKAYRDSKKLGLGHHPASTTRKHSQWSVEDVRTLVEVLRNVPPDKR